MANPRQARLRWWRARSHPPRRRTVQPMNADSLAAEVLGAAREVGADVEELDEDTAQAVRSQLIGRYSKHAGAARLWERLDGAAERQHQDSWRLIDRFLTDEPAIMLFEPTRER